MILTNTYRWHRKARPEPTETDFNVQLACMLEEVVELLESLRTQSGSGLTRLSGTKRELESLEKDLKRGKYGVTILDDVETLDALCDVIVTAVGVAHTKGYDILSAMANVNASNNSKFVDGEPQFDVSGKIIKGEGYFPPNLKDFV